MCLKMHWDLQKNNLLKFQIISLCQQEQYQNAISKDQPMSVLPADPMADVFFGTSADVRSDPMFSVEINNALKNANSCWHTTTE